MLRLLTIEKYLPVMTVQEQERFARDGEPFTLADVQRWQRLLTEKENKLNLIFEKAMKKSFLISFIIACLASCTDKPQLDISGRYYYNMVGLDSMNYYDIRPDGTFTKMNNTGFPYDGTWKDTKTSQEWKVPAREVIMKDNGNNVWRICFIQDSASRWMLNHYDKDGKLLDGWYATKQ